MIPLIEVESNSGVREVSLQTRHLMNRKVFLLGEITTEKVNDVLMQLMFLDSEGDEPVKLYINSPGGEVMAGLLLYDAMKGMHAPVYTYAVGTAASMGAVILAAGEMGHRYIFPHSKVMIHEPLIGQSFGGSASSIKNISESILETKNLLNSILAEHTGKSIEEINEATSYDNFMDAREAVNFGICDTIVNYL